MDISLIGFGLIASIVLLKIFETNLFFIWRAVAFLVLGSASLILVIFLVNVGDKEEKLEEKSEPENDVLEEVNETLDDGGEINEEDNSDN